MKCNVGKSDKILRVLIGLIIIGTGFYFKSWWGGIGIVPILTAVIGWCPLYTPLRISTCKIKT
jgi:hypothetical protein